MGILLMERPANIWVDLSLFLNCQLRIFSKGFLMKPKLQANVRQLSMHYLVEELVGLALVVVVELME